MASEEADRHAAANPSTSLETLDALVGPWPEEVATNAAVSKRPLEDLELRTIWAMCSSPTVGKTLDYDLLIDRLNGHDDLASRAVRFAYLANPTLPKAERIANLHGLTDDDLRLFRERLSGAAGCGPDDQPHGACPARAAGRTVAPRRR